MAGLLACLTLTFLAGGITATVLWRLEVRQRHRAKAHEQHIRRAGGDLFGWVDRELRLQQPGTEGRAAIWRTWHWAKSKYIRFSCANRGVDETEELARTEWWRRLSEARLGLAG